LNIGARGNNTATILRRGFADEQGNEGIRMRGDEDDILMLAVSTAGKQ
jgi:hypothetical protein